MKSKIKLSKYDNKIVSITDINDDIYEGLCVYNNIDYNEHEFDRSEDSLVMSYIMFFNSDIKSVKELKEFTNNYGKLEQLVCNEGIDIIDEVLDSEDDISIIRLLNYLNDNIKSFSKNDIDGIIDIINKIYKYIENDEIINLMNEFKKKAEII